MTSKEMFMEEHERLTAEAEDAGMDYNAAYASTIDAAGQAVMDRVAARIDAARAQIKERGL